MDERDEITDEEEEHSSTPLWKYVTKLPNSKAKGGGGRKWICNFQCKKEPYTGSYARVRAHLVGLMGGKIRRDIVLCPKVGKEEREILKKEELEVANKSCKLSDTHSNLLAKSLSSSSTLQGKGKGTIPSMFNLQERGDVNATIARCMYGNGIPFHVARSPLWVDMVRAINCAPKGYMPPNYEKVRTTLLDKEKSQVQKDLAPLMDEWRTYGISIVSDGWTNVKNQSLVNIMAVSGGKAMFVSGHDCSSIEKSGQNIAEIILKAIEKVGPYNVVQVITDNAANCKAAGSIIEQEHQHIFWSGCLAHTLNLLMKDIGCSKEECLEFVEETYKKGKRVVKYIKNHSQNQYIFLTFSNLDLLKVKKTTFGHIYIVLRRLVEVRRHLMNMVLDTRWKKLKKGGADDEHDKIQQIIKDDEFWKQAELILRFTRPIWNMLRYADSDKAIMGEVYEQMDIMLGRIKEALDDHPLLYDTVHSYVVQRWDKLNIPLHCLAFVLTPKYYSQTWLSTPAPSGVKRVKPHCDAEVHKSYLDALDKIVRDPKEAKDIREKISDFVSNKNIFARPQSIIDRGTMNTIAWWDLYGSVETDLHALAMKVLSQSVNTSCAERCWSTYNYIHSVKRNRLNCERAKSLVYIHFNTRLLTRYRDDYETKYKKWDKYDADSYIEDDIIALEALDDHLHCENQPCQDDDESFPTTPIISLPSAQGQSNDDSTSQPSSVASAVQKRLDLIRGKRVRLGWRD